MIKGCDSDLLYEVKAMKITASYRLNSRSILSSWVLILILNLIGWRVFGVSRIGRARRGQTGLAVTFPIAVPGGWPYSRDIARWLVANSERRSLRVMRG